MEPDTAATLTRKVAHLFRRPQVASSQLCDMLVDDATSERLPTRFVEDLHTLRHHLTNTLDVTDDLVGLLRLELIPPSFATIPLNTVIQRAVTKMETLANSVGCHIAFPRATPLVRVQADGSALQNAVMRMLRLLLLTANPRQVEIHCGTEHDLAQVTVTNGVSSSSPSLSLIEFLDAHTDDALALDLLYCFRVAHLHRGNFAVNFAHSMTLSILHTLDGVGGVQ